MLIKAVYFKWVPLLWIGLALMLAASVYSLLYKGSARQRLHKGVH